MPPPLPTPASPHSSIDALLAMLEGLVDVVLVRLPDVVARLELSAIERPLIWLDVDSSAEDQCWALIDALRAIALGPAQAQSARWVRRLRSVG